MRRRTLLGLSSAVLWPLSAWAKARRSTPSQMEGPFYPVKPIPLRNDLIRDETAVLGEAMTLNGRVLDQSGQALAGIRVEIWQCDGRGLYDHPRQRQTEDFDPAFAGFGAALTDEQGRYAFRTLFPVPYTGRPPHIHVKLWREQRELLTSQLYLPGQAGSAFDSRRNVLQMQIGADASGGKTAVFEFVV